MEDSPRSTGNIKMKCYHCSEKQYIQIFQEKDISAVFCYSCGKKQRISREKTITGDTTKDTIIGGTKGHSIGDNMTKDTKLTSSEG